MWYFESTDYRKLLGRIIENKKNRGQILSLSEVATKADIQLSYLSNTLGKRTHLNLDQLYQLGEVLELSKEEGNYLSLLLEWERSVSRGRKAKLWEEIKSVREEALQLQKHVRGAVEPSRHSHFYLDPNCMLVHAFLKIPTYAENPSLVAEKLKLSTAAFQNVLSVLEQEGYIRPTKKGYEAARRNLHLPDADPLCALHQYLMRFRSVDFVYQLPANRKKSYVATFHCEPETFVQIQARLLDFIKAMESLVRSEAGPKDPGVYQLNIELFPWS